MNLFPAQHWRYRQRQQYISGRCADCSFGVYYDYVLANPPFGKKSSQTFTNEEGNRKKKTSPTTARTSGQPPATSN
jgi:type I restriction-modification system DNA methylase subunit